LRGRSHCCGSGEAARGRSFHARMLRCAHTEADGPGSMQIHAVQRRPHP
jgi:hypothetical protein